MSRKHLRRDPQRVGCAEDWWYYEENAGIAVVVELYDKETLTKCLGTRSVRIPWTRIRAALARKDA